MSRPADWWVLDLGGDPTPGEPAEILGLSRRVRRVAEDAERAEREVRSLAGDGAVLAWVGLAGEVFRGAIEDFPTQLAKLADSYGQCSVALSGFAGELDGAQDTADRALEQGRAARAEIDGLGAQLSVARSSASSASLALSGFDSAGGAEPPDPEQVQAAVRNAQAAGDRVGALSSSLGAAQGRLEAAKRMARDAENLRNDAGDRARNRLYDASEAGIEPNSWWENFKSGAAKVWAVTITIAKIVVAVLAIVVLIIGGPLAWVVVGLSVLILADALMKVRNGEGGWLDVAIAALGLIPGVKGLTSLGALKTAFRGGGLLGAITHVGAAGRTAIVGMAQAIRSGSGRLVHRVAGRVPVGDVGAVRLPFGPPPSVAGLSADDLAIARPYLDRAAAAEPAITSRMRQIRDGVPGAEFAGLDKRLKDADSFLEKVAADSAKFPLFGIDDLASNINDAVRYTFTGTADSYADIATTSLRKLRDAGFEQVKPVKNSWGEEGYQGINSTWRDPSTRQTFEVQLHTPESLAAKESTHRLYEQQRALPGGESNPEWHVLQARQREIFSTVPLPPGARDVAPP